MSGNLSYTTILDSSFTTMAPSATRRATDLEGDASGYSPGGVPYMTDRPLNEPGVDKRYAQNTNGAVYITISTRTSDQKIINSKQLAFIDNKRFDRPVLLSLQTLNKMLVEEATPQFNSTTGAFGNTPGPLSNKKEILERFKLLGIVRNDDSGVPSGRAFSRGMRTFTVTSWGSTEVLDYWSTRNKTIRPYDKCYLVLKKVKLDSNYTFQNDMSVVHHNIPMPFSKPIDLDMAYWQIVPYFCRDTCVPVEAYTSKWTDKNGVQHVDIGTYWRIGNVHEYGDISHPDIFSGRDDTAVARDVSYLVEGGRVKPFQFYLHLDDDKII